MSFNEANILRDHGQFAGVVHRSAGSDVLDGSFDSSPASLGNFRNADLDSAEFPMGADTSISGENGFLVGAADGDGRYHWNGDESGRDWVRLHSMKFSDDDRPGPAAYAHSLMHAGMDFNRNPEENCREVMQAGREFHRSVDPYSLNSYDRDAHDRLGWDVDENGSADPATCRRILETANELVGGMKDAGIL